MRAGGVGGCGKGIRTGSANAQPVSQSFDPAEIEHGQFDAHLPPFGIAIAPLVVVVRASFAMNMIAWPRIDPSYLADARWGGTL
ncbi:hypothetical protein J8I87_36765 [Paraburkholderia sp. LEh10]|uniref:hypothetical protein n=1 Tax=Paraburkholderia sp. LEh10 TaxID=2821353 RepID=UPI001AE6FA17|nr:hypothetical protein [Paraburkholderia sp. LEh10]MBP0595116.1 hypothetical protein [Paraburkholderia sp. LEh10]